MAFAIVEFIDESQVAVVPASWLNVEEDMCYWLKTKKLTSLMKTLESPQPQWQKFKVRVLGKAVTYQRALQKQKSAEMTSDINTEGETTGLPSKRRKVKPKRIEVSSDDSSSAETHISEEWPASPPLLNSNVSSAVSTLIDNLQIPSLECIELPSLNSQSQKGEQCVGEVLQKVLKIALENQQQLKVLTTLVQTALGSTAGVVEALPESLNVPMRSMEDIDELEERLNEPSFQHFMAKVLRDIGGRSIEEMVRRVMKFLFQDSLAIQCNMSGRNGKRGLGSTNIFNVVFCSIKLNVTTATINKKKLEEAMSKWLVGSRDRGGNRVKRANSTKRKHATAELD